MSRTELNLTELKEALWRIVRADGIEVTNQNIDWLLQRAYKEAKDEQNA